MMDISEEYQLGPLERLALIFGGEGGKGAVCLASAIENYKKYLAELLGTFALVFVGSGCVCADYYLVKSGSQGFGLLGIAIAFGFVVVAVAYSLGYISGAHINPAVTVSMVATRRIKAGVGGMYIISQIAGATLAGYLLKILFPEALASVFLGTCVLGSSVTVTQAIVMEAVITFLLVFVVYATVIDKRSTPALAGLAIGFVVLFGVMVGGAISGGSMNPARVFGPAIASGHFANHYVWWIGPIVGGVFAGFTYDMFFSEKKKQLSLKKGTDVKKRMAKARKPNNGKIVNRRPSLA
jgi:glycerol uptake facilitator protein